MSKTIKASIILLILFVVGCTNADDNTQTNNEDIRTQPIHYETESEQKARKGLRDKTIGEQGGYPQSDQEGVNASDYSGGYSDVFTNEESEFLANELQAHRDIIQAQVASTEDRIIVAVMLREHSNHDVAETIETEVREVIPETDKQIIIYTDDIYWDRMKNLDARLEARDVGEDLEDYITDFFNRND
ncbi:YhcN/YlaJ family sporulation lipoprotein [Virgibacillus sp. C22-A2]|uniref:YhcN/YlaJ family sporulation lipoprotein n=1 Tax=Virgibacillus tibetensis TaxID=3042313 RepID=A0ABU6KC14_9BACI|nr:YhcN/YlaJ family sporulation lipoprotein [Virgibacillus sp. C22-A2]